MSKSRKTPRITCFPANVTQELGNYVYRLEDQNGVTFYVGKGSGNRIFYHEQEADDESAKITPKIKRIREIWQAGGEVHRVIHRHGIDKTTALHIEAALMRAYEGLTNDKGGYREGELGSKDVETIIQNDNLQEADLTDAKYLLVRIGSSYEWGMKPKEVFRCAQYSWPVNPIRAANVDYVLASCAGIIVGVFKAVSWLPATEENFQGRDNYDPTKYGFRGEPAPEPIQAELVNTRLPAEYRRRGAVGIRYINA